MRGNLYITDGTTRINLLSGIDGFYLDEWDPAIAGRKSVWRDSPLTDGRKPALMKWSNATETMKFKISHFTQDDVIYETQELRRLLLAAEEYFMGGSDVPVWIEARGDCETNTRYAPIVTWGTGNDSDPYHKPFDLDNPVMAPWTLMLERQHWRHMAPGTSECVELGATQDYYDEQQDDWSPTESGDDCWAETTLGNISVIDNLRIGQSADLLFCSGIRFQNVTIPQGAHICKAWVTLTADANRAGNTVRVKISCNDIDNAVAFTTYALWNGLARTTANTTCSLGAWTLGTTYATPDISSAVQEVVNRGGWGSGHALSVLIDEDGSDDDAYRTAYSWDDAGQEPILYVWWFDTRTLTFGRTATCNNEVYVANKHNIAQITHIYINDGGIFDPVNYAGNTAFALLPAAPQAFNADSDAVNFGIATVAPDSGPFCSLVFDIGITNDLDDISWEYWNGAWVNLALRRDNTNADGWSTGHVFDTAGVNSVHWVQPSDWVTTAVNGITGYWVRARVTAVAGIVRPPTQQNRSVYTVVTPFVLASSTTTVGDITALAQLIAEGQSGFPAQINGEQIVWAGLKEYSGTNFTAFLNLSDTQTKPLMSAVNNPPDATDAGDVTCATGRCIDWTTPGASAEDWLVYVRIPAAMTNDYIGEYRAFLRLRVNQAVAQQTLFRLKVCMGGYLNPYYMTTQMTPKGSNGTYTELLDFGKISIPPIQTDTGETFFEWQLRIDGQALSAVHVHLYEIILIPTDRCVIETRAIMPVDGTAIFTHSILNFDTGIWKRLDMNSLIPRRMIKTDLKDQYGAIPVAWANKISGPLIWEPYTNQCWWFVQSSDLTTYRSDPWETLSLQGFQVSRYLSMRGKR